MNPFEIIWEQWEKLHTAEKIELVKKMVDKLTMPLLQQEVDASNEELCNEELCDEELCAECKEPLDDDSIMESYGFCQKCRIMNTCIPCNNEPGSNPSCGVHGRGSGWTK